MSDKVGTMGSDVTMYYKRREKRINIKKTLFSKVKKQMRVIYELTKEQGC